MSHSRLSRCGNPVEPSLADGKVAIHEANYHLRHSDYATEITKWSLIFSDEFSITFRILIQNRQLARNVETKPNGCEILSKFPPESVRKYKIQTFANSQNLGSKEDTSSFRGIYLFIFAFDLFIFNIFICNLLIHCWVQHSYFVETEYNTRAKDDDMVQLKKK